MTMDLKRFTWDKPQLSGLETAAIRIRSGELFASALGAALTPVPHRFRYELWTAGRYITTSVNVHAEGMGWTRALDLQRDSDGRWRCSVEQRGEVELAAPGCDPAILSTALDCDVGNSPVTNTMPVLRENLLSRGACEFDIAFVEMPSLAVKLSQQRYEHLSRTPSGALVRFRSGTFQADLTLDENGIVVLYPGLATLLE